MLDLNCPLLLSIWLMFAIFHFPLSIVHCPTDSVLLNIGDIPNVLGLFGEISARPFGLEIFDAWIEYSKKERSKVNLG